MDYSGLAASLWEGIKGLGSDALGLFYDDGKINLQNLALLGGLYGISRADDSETLGNLLGTSNPTPVGYTEMAGGGLASLNHQGYYLGGPTDGMADQIPAMIGNSQPAALSDGEFVIPADVVSHLGNGNSDAGAQELFSMMDRVRQARTGRAEQGKEINPNKYLA